MSEQKIDAAPKADFTRHMAIVQKELDIRRRAIEECARNVADYAMATRRAADEIADADDKAHRISEAIGLNIAVSILLRLRDVGAAEAAPNQTTSSAALKAEEDA